MRYKCPYCRTYQQTIARISSERDELKKKYINDVIEKFKEESTENRLKLCDALCVSLAEEIPSFHGIHDLVKTWRKDNE